MNIISRLTVRHLKQNMKRTLVTTLGIAASTALITTMCVGITSFFAFFGKVAVNEEGNWHCEFENLTPAQIECLKKESEIKSVAITDTDTELTGVRMHTDVSDRLKLGNITRMNGDGIRNSVVCKYDGKLPENENEIAVEDQFLKDNNLNINVGDEITFDLGKRYIIDPDGKKTAIAGNYNSNEKFSVKAEKTLIVSAILHKNGATAGFDVIGYLPSGKIPMQNNVDICLKRCDFTAHKQLKEIAKKYNLKISSFNTEYLISVFSFDADSRGVAGIIPAGIFALMIIVATSVILIYNAFGMSLTEKIRYLGMLASVGATKRQKRWSIIFEGIILGIFGIPIGILVGCIGTFVTISVLGKAMISANMFEGAKGMSEQITLHAPLPVFAFIIAIASITIYISALIPAIRASKIMPIDALRQNYALRLKGSKLRVNPLVKRLFGYEGELAYKNIKRNGSKSAIITFSIIASIVMFLTITSFNRAFERNNSFDFDVPYQLYAKCAVEDSDRLKKAIEENPLTERCYTNDVYEYKFTKDKKNPDFVPANSDILNSDFLNKGFEKVFDGKEFYVATIDDSDFKKLLEDNGLSSDEYFEGTLKGVLLNDFYRRESKHGVFDKKIIGQVLHYDKVEGNPPAIEIAGLVNYSKDNYIFNLVPKNTVVIYVPETPFYAKDEETLGKEFACKTIAIETGDTSKLYEEIIDLLEKGNYRNYSYGNMEEAVTVVKTVSLLLKTVMYGFTTLVTLIALANLVNIISTGVTMRRKEFAMLRSVGMTERGFNRMIGLETLLYGIRSLVVGIPLALFLSYAMLKKANSDMAFEVDIIAYIAAAAAVFAVLGISMLLGISKIKDDEIIEALKEDVC